MNVRSFADSIKLLGMKGVRRFTSLSGLYCKGEILMYTFAASARLTMGVDTRLTLFAARAIPVTSPALLRHILQLCSRNHGKENIHRLVLAETFHRCCVAVRRQQPYTQHHLWQAIPAV